MSKTLFVCQEGDYERPQGGLLVNAAINITRAVSQFMGLVLQVSIGQLYFVETKNYTIHSCLYRAQIKL